MKILYRDCEHDVSRGPLEAESAGMPDALQTLRDQARWWTNSRQRLECVRLAGAFGLHTARDAVLSVTSSNREPVWRILSLLGGERGWAVALLAFLIFFRASVFSAEPPTNPSIEGAWKWTFNMPDGSQVTPRLDLKLADGQLTGATRFRPGSETPITNLVVNGSAVSFEVVREREGEQVVTRYSGVWTGDTIKGKIVSNWTGTEQTYDWEARRVTDANGTWKWSANAGGRRIESKLTLTQDGEKLTGKITSGRGDTDIKKGKIKKGDLSFEVERDRDGEMLVSRYYGKLTGNKIEGKMELNFTGEPRTNKWEAVRAD